MPDDKRHDEDKQQYTVTSYSPQAIPPPPPPVTRASGANFLQPPYFLPQPELEYASRANLFARPPPHDRQISTEMVDMADPGLDPGIRHMVEAKKSVKKHIVYRLRPWALTCSIIFLIIGGGMIACTFASYGTSRSLWGILTGGVSYFLAAVIGIAAATSLRPTLAFLAFLSIATAWVSSLAVVIVNATSLNEYTLTQCNLADASRFSSTCESIREYHYIVFTFFGVITAIWVPTLIVTMGFLWRLTNDLWKDELTPSTENYNL